MNTQYTPNYKQLLASTLREQPDSCMINDLLSQYPHPSHLIDVTEQELIRNIKGIGALKAKQIISAVLLVREFAMPFPEPVIIRSPDDVNKLMEMELAHASKEHFICLFLNTKNHVIAKELISVGTLNSSLVHPREVFRAAIKRNSASIICCHNHPSGDPSESPEDVQITHRLVNAGEIIGISVLDHIIIGRNRFVSMREKGLMEKSSLHN